MDGGYCIYNPSAGKIRCGPNWQVTHQLKRGVRVVQMLILQAYDQLLSTVESVSSIAFRSSQVRFLARLIFNFLSATDERMITENW